MVSKQNQVTGESGAEAELRGWTDCQAKGISNGEQKRPCAWVKLRKDVILSTKKEG